VCVVGRKEEADVCLTSTPISERWGALDSISLPASSTESAWASIALRSCAKCKLRAELNCCLLFHQWRQMDLELTAWQMLYMCMAPSVVYASCVYPVGCVAVCSLLLHCFSSLQLPAYDISQTCAAVSHTCQP
jgi:UNC-50 family